MTDEQEFVRITEDFDAPLEPFSWGISIPDTDYNEEPTVFLELNRKWYSRLLGAAETLLRRSAWEGTAEAVEAAIQSVENLLIPVEAGMSIARQNEEAPCVLEQSFDDGETWEPFANLQLCIPGSIIEQTQGEPPEDYDPQEVMEGATRHPATEATTEDKICAASVNAARVLAMTHHDIQRRWEGGADVLELAIIIVTALALFWGAPWLAIAIADAILSGTLNIAYMFGSEFSANQEKMLKCMLVDHASVSGDIVTFDYGAVMVDIAAQVGFTANSWGGMWFVLHIVGLSGLEVAAGMRIVPDPDCSDCEECYGWTVDYVTDDNDAQLFTSQFFAAGTHQMGTGWLAMSTGGTNRGISIIQYGGWVKDINRMRINMVQPQNTSVQMLMQERQGDGSWLTIYNWYRSSAGTGDGWSAWQTVSASPITGELRMIISTNAVNGTTVCRGFEVGNTSGDC